MVGINLTRTLMGDPLFILPDPLPYCFANIF